MFALAGMNERKLQYSFPHILMDDQTQEETDQKVTPESHDQNTSEGSEESALELPPEQWQKVMEKAKKKAKKELLEKMADRLKDDDEMKGNDERDPIEVLSERFERLEASNHRKDWEADHPFVRSEEVKEKWDAIVKEKEDLVRTGRLTYDELLALSGITQPKQSKPSSQSVPQFSKTTPSGEGITESAKRYMQKRGLTVEQWKALSE